MNRPEPDDIWFQAHRARLFALAYRMLGSASDAEDVLQDAFVRASTVERDTLRAPGAWLRTVVTRLCLDRLKAARHTREQYLGVWLPEPVLTEPTNAPDQVAEQHESITMAFLVLLEQLTPPERAVLVLREVFEYGYAEIAQTLRLSEANCRQLLHRAKHHLAAGRPRFAASAEHQQDLVTRFLAASERGDVAQLTALLADDVVFWIDTGGTTPAPRRPVSGRRTVARLMVVLNAHAARLVDGATAGLRTDVRRVNGEVAALVFVHGSLDGVLVCSVEHDTMTALRLVRNPDKLRYIGRQLQEHPRRIG